MTVAGQSQQSNGSSIQIHEVLYSRRRHYVLAKYKFGVVAGGSYTTAGVPDIGR